MGYNNGGREFWSHFEASQLKEDATTYERWRHLRWEVYEGCDEPSSERPIANVMARYKWTGVWIANKVAMMSMETNAGLTFMDIAPMLKINELEDIFLGQ